MIAQLKSAGSDKLAGLSGEFSKALEAITAKLGELSKMVTAK
jgi:hypothetical protein